MEGIASHLEALKKKINEENEIIPILMADINTLEEQIAIANPPLNQKELAEKQKHLQSIIQSIQLNNPKKLTPEDFSGYIHATKEDRVYCGLPQIIAISQMYDIPIRVLYMYGTLNQREETYHKADNSALPVITIAHINGNHFQYVDD